jgi:phosphatidylglycerophosphate synthase
MSEDVAPRRGPLVTALLLGAGVAVALGVYGRVHEGSYDSLPSLGFSTAGAFKAWATSVVLLLALSQLVTALWLYGRLPGVGRAPSWLGSAHRATGTLAFVLSLPVAAYCLYGFGFSPEPFRTRTFIHSVAGCALYGAFAAKVVLVRSHRIPGWALPAAGGLLLTSVAVLWQTGAVWFFDVEGVHT